MIPLAGILVGYAVSHALTRYDDGLRSASANQLSPSAAQVPWRPSGAGW